MDGTQEGTLPAPQGKKNLAAVWKMISPELDKTGGMSMSQESMLYIPPVEGATTSRFNRKKSAISEYLNKSIQLHVNLKSTSH